MPRRPKPDRANHAVVYVPETITDPAEFAAAAAPCLERVEACGYAFGGIVRRWADARQLLFDRRVQVLIVQDPGHLPADRLPRIEVANDPVQAVAECVVPPAATVSQRQRRPRRVR